MMTKTMRTVKTPGLTYKRIYKMPATWTSYITDITPNPHNFAMKALLASFSLEKM